MPKSKRPLRILSSRSLVPPLGVSMPGPKNRPCTVEMTQGQAKLIARAMAFFVDKTMGLSPTELEEAEALCRMATEVDPDVINGWCL